MTSAPHVGRPIVWLSILALACADERIARAAGPTLADLRLGLADAEASVQNFSVTIQLESTTRVFPKFTVVSKPVHTVIVFTGDRDGRFKYDRRGPTIKPDGSLTPILFCRGSFDSILHKELSGETTPTRGFISSKAMDVAWGISPRDLFYEYIGVRLSKLIDEKAIISGEEVIGGQKMVVVDTPQVVGVDNVKRQYRFLVSPAQGFAVVRRTALRFVPARNSWHPYDVQEFSDYRQSDAGVWAPGTAVQTWYIIAQNEEKPSRVMSKTTATFSNYTLNANLPADTYSTIFLPGLQVTDHRTGKEMIIVDATAKPLDKVVLAGREAYDQAIESKPRIKWYVAGVVIVALAALSIYFLRRRTSKTIMSSNVGGM